MVTARDSFQSGAVPVSAGDARGRAARGGLWIAAFIGVSGLLATFQWFVGRNALGGALLYLAFVAFSVASIAALLPWGRLGDRALRFVPPLVSAMIALALTAGANPATGAGLFALLAVWVGLFRPPHAGWPLAFWVLIAYAGPLVAIGAGATALRSTASTMAVVVVVAEVISRTLREMNAARAEAERVSAALQAASAAARNMRTLSPDGVFRELVDAVRGMGFEVAGINTADRASRRFRLRAAAGLRTANFAHGLAEGISGEAFARQKTIIVDYASSEVSVGALQGEGLRLLAAVPIVARGAVAAVLVAGNRDMNALPSWALDALDLIATEAGLALEHAEAFQKQKDIAATLTEETMSDTLTGLQNRRGVQRALAKLEDGDCVVMIDLDHFKEVNDSDGHAAGDEVLVRLGDFLRSSLRAEDFASRWGGEEFLVVLQGAGDEGARIIERLLFRWRSTRPRTTFSVGMAIHRRVRTPDETLRAADTALYRAKRDGRDRLACAA